MFFAINFFLGDESLFLTLTPPELSAFGAVLLKILFFNDFAKPKLKLIMKDKLIKK